MQIQSLQLKVLDLSIANINLCSSFHFKVLNAIQSIKCDNEIHTKLVYYLLTYLVSYLLTLNWMLLKEPNTGYLIKYIY